MAANDGRAAARLRRPPPAASLDAGGGYADLYAAQFAADLGAGISGALGTVATSRSG